MKTSHRLPLPTFAAAAAALAFSPCLPAFAQTAVTDPVGFTTLTVAAKPAATRGFTYLSLNMARASVYRGLVPSGGVSTVNGVTTLTFPAGSFTPSPFAGAGDTYYVELKSGSSIGLTSTITQTTDSSITLADNITSAIAGGTTTLIVRPYWTPGTAFGPTDSAGLQGGASQSRADVVQVLNSDGSLSSLYYNTNANNGIGQWQIGSTPATNFPFPVGAGLIVERKSTTPVSFNLTGDVKLGPTAIYVAGGSAQATSVVPNPYPLASVQLKDLTLWINDDVTKGFVGGVSASRADSIGLYDPATGFTTNYYYNTSVDPTLGGHWVTGTTLSDSVVIPSGAAVVINRKFNRQAFNWYMPQPAMNLN